MQEDFVVDHGSWTLKEVIEMSLLHQTKNTDKHIIFVDSCATWCRGAGATTTSLRSSTDLAKGDGCELGRPRLEEFNFDEELTKDGCKRVETDNTIKEKKVCEALAQVGLKIGSILTLDLIPHPPQIQPDQIRIQGFEGGMVKLAPTAAVNRLNNTEGQRHSWFNKIYFQFYPNRYSRPNAPTFDIPVGEKYGEFGWHPRHLGLPTINIPYEKIVEYERAVAAKKRAKNSMRENTERASSNSQPEDPQPLVPAQIEALRPLEDETKLLGAKRDTLEKERTEHSSVRNGRLADEYFRRGTKKHHLNLAAKLRSTIFWHGIRDSVPIEELAATHEAIADRIGKVKEAHVALSKSHPTLAWKDGWIGKKTRKYKNHDGTTQSLGYYHGKNITEDGTTPMKFKKGGRKTLKRKRKTRKRKTRKGKTRKGKTRKRKTRKRKTHRKKKISRRIMV